MIWGGISVIGSMVVIPSIKNDYKRPKISKLLKEKLELHVTVHDCNMFMHDWSPCHHFENGATFSRPKKFKLLDWSGYNPEFNLTENLSIMSFPKATGQNQTTCPQIYPFLFFFPKALTFCSSAQIFHLD